jgi:hypothetical protein
MFLWLIGLATSLSLLFQDMGQGAFLVTLPLWCLGIFFMVYYVRFSEINVDLLWFGTLMSAVLISLNQISEDLLPNAATLILLHMVIGGALFVYAIRVNVACDDVVDRRLNWLSQLAFVVSYLLFYGVEIGSVERWIPLLPAVIFVFSEVFIIYRYDNQTTLYKEFRQTLRQERIANVLALVVLIIMLIFRLLYAIDDHALYTASIIVYAIGLAWLRRSDIPKVQAMLKSNTNTDRLTNSEGTPLV